LFVESNIASAKYRKIGYCKIFRGCSLESENGITGFLFSGVLKKKRGHKNGNGEIGEEVSFRVSA